MKIQSIPHKCKKKGCKRIPISYDIEYCTECFMKAIREVLTLKEEK